jgi:hypothetical protein
VLGLDRIEMINQMNCCSFNFYYQQAKIVNYLFTPLKCMGGVVVSLHAFFTTPLDGGEWSTSLPGHSTPGERTLPPIEKEVEWSTEQIWTFWRQGNCSLNKQYRMTGLCIYMYFSSQYLL